MANKQKIKGAEALLLSLIAEGTDTIFGYPGGQVIPIYDHLYHHTDRLHHILTRHEQGAVHAAQGYARATGKVGVCLATSGPGATNLVTGIADAMLDSTPIVCITGQVPAALLGTDAFQEADTISMTMPISKWNYQVTKASEIPRAIARAYYIARTGRPGPVVIDISKNAQVEEFDFSYKPCIYLRSYHPKPELDKQAVARAVEMLNASEKPLILVGQGVKLAGAERRLVELAEAAGAPMASTLMGISAVPSGHPLFVGNLGMHGNIAANEMTQQSDLILAVGMRFSDRVTGDVKNYAPHAKIIHIDIDSAELGKNLPVELPIHADAGEALEAMKSGIRHKDRSAWIDVAKGCDRREYEEVVRPSSDPQGRFISMYDAISTLAEVEKGDAVIVTDVGQNQMFSARYSKFNSTRSFITSGLRPAGRAGGQARRARPRGRLRDGRRRFPDDDAGTGHDHAEPHRRQDDRAEQLVFGHGAPMAAAFLREALLVHAYRKPRPDADRRGLRHPEPPGHRARTAQGGHRGTGRRAGSLPARGGRAPRGKRIPDGTGRRLAVGHHLHGLKTNRL